MPDEHQTNISNSNVDIPMCLWAMEHQGMDIPSIAPHILTCLKWEPIEQTEL